MTTADLAALARLDPRPDIRLVVSDMDGTLLDDKHQLPDGFESFVAQLAQRGVTFAVASGRHEYSLRRLLPSDADIVVIASNGAHVIEAGREVFLECLDRDRAVAIVERIRDVPDARAVVTTRTTAFTEDADEQFLGWLRTVLPHLEVVQPISELPSGCLISVGIFDHRSAESNSLPALGPLADGLNVMATAPTWVDVVSAAADKGSAVRRLQRERGITRDQTAAFGDFLNDLTLLEAATYSFAMANAHPEVHRRAAWRAPANTESGVTAAVAALIGMDVPG